MRSRGSAPPTPPKPSANGSRPPTPRPGPSAPPPHPTTTTPGRGSARGAPPGVVRRSLGVGRRWSLRRGMPFLGVGRGTCRGALFLCASVPAPAPSLGGFLPPRCVSSGALSLWAPAPHLGRLRAPLPECPLLSLALPLPPTRTAEARIGRRTDHTSAHPPATGNDTGDGGQTYTGRTGYTHRGSRREHRRAAHHHALTAR